MRAVGLTASLRSQVQAMKVDLYRLVQHANRFERTAMNRTRPKLIKRREMFGSAVAFVLGKVVLWKLLVELSHQPVARDFGDDTGCGNGKTLRVPADDGFLLNSYRAHRQPVDKNEVRLYRQRVERQHHCTPCRAKNVVRIDDVNV